jgi:hypothetical protein
MNPDTPGNKGPTSVGVGYYQVLRWRAWVRGWRGAGLKVVPIE